MTSIHFKSLITNETVIMDLPNLTSNVCQLFPIIKQHILQKLNLNCSDYTIQLFNIQRERVNSNSTDPFAYCCDSIHYPALYFKEITYLELSRELQTMNTEHLIQQIHNSDSDSDSDSIPDLITDDDDNNINIINEYLVNNYINHNNFIDNSIPYNIYSNDNLNM